MFLLLSIKRPRTAPLKSSSILEHFTKPSSQRIEKASSYLKTYVWGVYDYLFSPLFNEIIFINSCFFYSHADEIFSKTIHHVLENASSIEEIPIILLHFFQALKGQSSTAACNEEGGRQEKKKGGVDRILLATGVASIVGDLMGSLLRNRPDNVLDHLIKVMREKINPSILKNRKKNFGIDCPERKKTPVNTQVTSKLADAPRRKTLVVLLLGIGGSGKTTLISVLKGKNDPKCKPSLGFRPITLNYNDSNRIKFYDIGGSDRIRGIWNNYYHDVHSIVVVNDSSSSQTKWDGDRTILKEALGHKFLQGKPLLVFNNKTDISGSRSDELVASDLNLNIKGNPHGRECLVRVVGTSLHPMRATFNGKPDPIIDKSLDWLLRVTLANIDDLVERVDEDCKEVHTRRTRIKVIGKKSSCILSPLLCIN